MVKKRLQSEEGAVVVEALALSLVLVGALMIVILVGSAYWNVMLLNSTAQSASLASQSLVDANCSPSRPAECNTDPAQIAVDDILETTEQQMIFGSNLRQEGGRVSIAPLSCQPLTLPNGSQIPTGGWGYSHVNLLIDFAPLGSGVNIPVRASSLSTSYRTGC